MQSGKKCDEAKDKMLNDQCEEIERFARLNPGKAHSLVRQVTGRKKGGCNASRCIEAKDRILIMEKEHSREVARIHERAV